MIGQPDGPEAVALCAAAVLHARTADAGDADAAFGDAVAALGRLRQDLPERAVLAADLIRALTFGGVRVSMVRLRALQPLLEMARRHPPTEPDWPRVRAAATITALMRAGVESELPDARSALREVDEIAAGFPDDVAVQSLRRTARATLGMLAGVAHGDESAMRAVLADLDQLRNLVRGNAELEGHLDGIAQLSAAWQASRNGDHTTALGTFRAVREQIDGLPDFVNDALVGAIAGAETILPLADDQPGPAGSAWSAPERLDVLRQLAERPDAPDGTRAMYLTLLGGAVMAGGNETDPGRIDAAIADLRAALALTPDHDPHRAFNLVSLALGLVQRAQAGATTAGLDEAEGLLEQARTAAGGPGGPYWPIVNDLLSDVRRRRGDPRSARAVALDGLRGYAWRVLLQPDPASARVAARHAAADAVDAAVWCLIDHDPVDALRALDAGRALMLFSATELRDPTTRLTEAGRPELARQWREAGSGRATAELREQVLEVLAGHAGLLDPPGLEEIQRALRTLAADALVYLVPGESPAPGWAVIAPADGEPRYLPLPNLVVDKGLEVERYLAALATRAACVVRPGPHREVEVTEARDRLLGTLDAVCEWAWKAAIGPVVNPYLVAGAARDAGPVPRIVLVPMGDLARIPWQAARNPDGGYAVEHVAISYAASARMLCDSAAMGPVALTSTGLVVADPDTAGQAPDLAAARSEAYAIHQAFYRGARYVGRRPDGTVSRSGAGSPDDVRGWLRADGPQAGTMLHLASHGVIETAPERASSYLLLAGGQRLAAEELVGAPGHPLGLVVLAACDSGRSVHGYDEAYSLGTMFLAAGARSVLSTQWSIPDGPTSLLMFMFHHYLAAEHRPAWDALRRAQLWMLDADRQAPAGMPEPLRRTLRSTDPSQVVAWAGFVHWGQ